MDHTIQLVSTLKTLGKELWLHTICQPTILNIEGPHCKLQYFYGSQDNVYLKDFQPRGMKWVYHKDMTSETLVATHFLARWCEPHHTFAQYIFHN